MDITSERNVQWKEITSERIVQGTDKQTLQVKECTGTYITGERKVQWRVDRYFM